MSPTEPIPTEPTPGDEVIDDSPHRAPVAEEREPDDVDVYSVVLATTTTPLTGPGLGARVGAEALGTFALVLVTLGTVLFSPLTGAAALGGALAAGLVLVGATAAFGHISGGHFNPAVTLGSAITGRTTWIDALIYVLAQVLGGVAAAAALFATIPTGLPGQLGLTGVAEFMATTANGWDAGSPLSVMSTGALTFDLRAALLLETVAAAILVGVVLGSAHRRAVPGTAPLAIGLTYTALILLLAPVTGGALNPARSTAAAIFSGGDALGQLWLFWVAPLVGATIAGLVVFAFGGSSDDVQDLDDLDDLSAPADEPSLDRH